MLNKNTLRRSLHELFGLLGPKLLAKVPKPQHNKHMGIGAGIAREGGTGKGKGYAPSIR